MLTKYWKKAEASELGSGGCVEVRRVDGVVQVRDTKANGQGPTLEFTESEWAAFLDGAGKGEFNL